MDRRHRTRPRRRSPGPPGGPLQSPALDRRRLQRVARRGWGCRPRGCRAGRLWLDLGAGPGGKAGLLAGLAARRGARLGAADIRPPRARLVSAAVTGAAGVVVADGTAPAWRPGSFDRVIADVPCSGLGALRRRPEVRWRKSPADVAALGGLQRGLLASALDAARTGGVVAYVTCSPPPAETTAAVAAVLLGRDDVAL